MGFLVLEGFAIVQTARILRWKISVGVENVGRDLWFLILLEGSMGVPQVNFQCGSHRRQTKSKEVHEYRRTITPAVDRSKGPRTGRERSEKDFGWSVDHSSSIPQATVAV